MESSIAILKVNRHNAISTGDPGPEGMVVIPAARTLNIEALGPRRYAFFDELGKEIDIRVIGQRAFNKKDPVQRRQWELIKLLAMIPSHENMFADLLLIDPDEDADAAIRKNEQEMELRNHLVDRKNDEQWLASVYRKVIGLASGIPIKNLLVGLLKKAADDVALFQRVTKDGKLEWVFDTSYFETDALLDLAVERGELVQEGDSFRYKDKTVFAMDRKAAIFELQTNVVVNAFFRERLAERAAKEGPSQRPDHITIENSSALKMANSLGTEIPNIPTFNTDGSVNQDHMVAQAEAARRVLIDKLVASQYIIEQDGSYLVTHVATPFSNLMEVEGYLKSNPQLELTLTADMA